MLSTESRRARAKNRSFGIRVSTIQDNNRGARAERSELTVRQKTGEPSGESGPKTRQPCRRQVWVKHSRRRTSDVKRNAGRKKKDEKLKFRWHLARDGAENHGLKKDQRSRIAAPLSRRPLWHCSRCGWVCRWAIQPQMAGKQRDALSRNLNAWKSHTIRS